MRDVGIDAVSRRQTSLEAGQSLVVSDHVASDRVLFARLMSDRFVSPSCYGPAPSSTVSRRRIARASCCMPEPLADKER